MELTLNDFYGLGRCLEGFFFGMISVNCQTQTNIAPFQDSIPEYLRSIYNTVDHNKTLIGRTISFPMPFGCYML